MTDVRKKYVTVDGNEAAAYIAYAFTEVAAIYPITPSSPMAGKTDVWAAKGKKNIFGQSVQLVEMQSEAGAIGAVHGALQTGALATSYTSSQGLMLMLPVMHRIAGERHPGVLHVASRTVGTHALSIFGDHSDVMNCRQTGFAMLSTGSVQEVMDLAGVAHLAAIKGRIPFLHFFDGFRTSHEIDKVEQMDYEDLKKMLDYEALDRIRAHALNPEHPMLRATVQNPDIFFQVREASNKAYDELPDIVESYMEKINAVTGRDYHLFNYYGAPDADRVIVAMGSVSGCVQEVVDHLNERGEKVGYLQIHLFRPFDIARFLDAIPKTCRAIAALDRTKETGSAGEPLYQDVCTAFKGRSDVMIVGGRYGLSSKDTTPSQILAVFENLKSGTPVNSFTIGIVDDVTHLSLPEKETFYPAQDGVVSCKFWGLGSDGTVGANKNTVEIINSHTPKFAQAYFEYDAKKSYGVTKSHLRFSDRPIRSSYYVKFAQFVACHNPTYIENFDIVSEIMPGGTLLLNCPWDAAELEKHLPAAAKRTIAERNISVWLIDAVKIANELGLGNHFNMVLQSAFFHLMPVIPEEDAVRYMKEAATKTYFAKGDEVVARNVAAIDAGKDSPVRIEVPDSWKDAKDEPAPVRNVPEVVTRILDPINLQKGDDLPVSTFAGYEDGVMDMGLTAFEKRGIATRVPVWDPEKCLQCNKCSFVCPHAVIRPYLMTREEYDNAPADMKAAAAKGKQADGMYYTLQVSALDCTGCGSCANCCPAKEKALTMTDAREVPQPESWEYALALSDKGDVFDPWTVKGSQFRQPLVEFSAACAGCGETPYAKLLTQLYGDRVYWANATGCSQAWGGAMPGIPYTVNRYGKGPAWTNSLFENNAEFSLGMVLSVRQQREAQKARIESYRAAHAGDAGAVCDAIDEWLAAYDDFDRSAAASAKLVQALEDVVKTGQDEDAKIILRYKDQLAKKTFWMYGGDGWAYDIGFGGLDHVIASGENVNVLIVDTEVYSNTGGQSSKATPIGAVAQFTASGKRRPKKDLGGMLMTYGNVYVAQVAMGADNAQLVKALHEAEYFDGPSVVIAYAPCQSHGLKCGMAKVQDEMKRAVEAGYWHLYRYNPDNEKPFSLDSKAPSIPYEEFLDGEVRYASLKRTFPDNAKELFAEGGRLAKKRYEELVKKA